MATRSGMQMHTNIVMGSFLKGTDALYTSFGKINKEASKAQKINMLKATNFPKLNSNLLALDKTLGRVEARVNKLNRRPLDFGLGAMTKDLKTGLRLSSQIEKNMSQTAFKSRMNAKNQSVGFLASPASPKITNKNKIKAKARLGVGVGVGLGTASVLGAVSAISPIRNAIEYESGMAEVMKSTNATSSQLKLLSKSNLDLVNKGSLLTPLDLAKIEAGGGTAGISVKKLPQFAKDVNMGSVALNLDTEKVGFVFADLANRINLPIEKIGILTNSITALENAGTVKGSSILNISSQLSNTYSALKLKPKNAMAISSFIRTAYATDETAYGGFKTFISGLQKTDSKYGYYKRLKGDASQLKPIVQEITAKYTPAQISKKFGGMAFQRSVSGMNVQIKNLDKYMAVVGTKTQKSIFDNIYKPDKRLSDSPNFMGAVQREYNVKLATTQAREIMAKNRITASSIVVGNQLKNPYIDSLNAVSNGMRTSTDFYTKHKEMLDKMAIATTGVLGASLIKKGASKINPFPKIATDLSNVNNKAKLATKSISSLKATLQSLAGVAKRNPIVLGSGVLAGGAMVGLNHMAKNADSLKERQNKIGKSLRVPMIDTLGVHGSSILKTKPKITPLSSLDISTVDVQSPSAMANAQIAKAKQITNNNQKHIINNIQNSIKVEVTDGSHFDEELFMTRLSSAQRRMKHDHDDTTFNDVPDIHGNF